MEVEREQICKACGETKPISEYHWRSDMKSNGGYRYICKKCACKRARESYEKNRESAIKRCAKAAKVRIQERRRYVYDYLTNNPCVKCGEANPILLEFNHVDPSTKDLTISRAIWNNWSMKRLNAEIDKCQVLCVRCHRLKTAEEQGWYKFDDE